MNEIEIDIRKKSLILFGLNDKLDFLINLYKLGKFPHVLMLSGNKGIGKSTLIDHMMNYIFDKNNYDFKKKEINIESSFYKQLCINIYPNIIYLQGDSSKNIKIDDIRNLKSKLFKSVISTEKRFIILDDIELFNINSLNALLKIIEEPSVNNHFIIINNNTKNLIKTIFSRSLELKIALTDKTRVKIIESLIKNKDIEGVIDYRIFNLSPGSFLLFNEIIHQYNLDLNEDYLVNFEKLLDLYKRNKNIIYINLILFLTDFYFHNLNEKNAESFERIIENKTFIVKNINKFVVYNLNQKSIINAINNKLSNG